tara:strand:- start:3279 stop:3572 length:294 start_codon:yes stop_codon:yes gene_type:complete
MNEIYKSDQPAWRCSDFAEHATALVEAVNRGDVIQHDNEQLDSVTVLLAMIEDDSDLVNKILSEMIIKDADDAKAFDAKTQELAEEAARSYKGQYDA